MKKIFIAMAFSTVMLSSLSVFAQTQSREDLLKEIAAKRTELAKVETELAKLEKAFLSPSEKDRAAYANFLRQPDTGLIRLYPRETYDSRSLGGIYVLRSVNYHASDTLVAFRVVRLDSDRSVIILWKLLKQYPTPILARN